MIAGTFRGYLPRYRTARVRIGGAASASVDLATPHGRRLYAYGFCEPAARAMRLLLHPGDVVIDGGANIGLFTLLAATLVGPDGSVVACEPSRGTMRLLRANVAANGLRWVHLREVALAEASGRLPMRMFEAGSGYSSFAPLDGGKGEEVDVEVTTLDQLAADISRPTSLVKLDVEGAELRALRGARDLLAGARPDLIIELEPEHLARQGSTVQEVQALLREAEYVAYAIGDRLEPLRGPWQRLAHDPNIVARPRERTDDV